MPLTKKFENLMIPLEAIKSATNNFSDDNCIGRGGFGKVYKGELVHSKGQTIVALKRLDPVFGQGNPEFWKEIVMLSLYKHENIISLIGFCDECNEKILVYEYASRRSLDFYLNNNELTWIRRLKICIGAARGLAYLHNPGASQQRVLHRDVKSSNILIDESWSAKISDLGLSKFGPANQKYTFLVSKTVGTIGYCDPLYVETGLLTKESDVYSFGVVLFEVLCGRLCISNKNGTLQSLTTLVRKYYVDNNINEIIYANMKEEINPRSLEAFTTIAYRCLNRELEKRPLMTDIVVSLETALAYQEEINPRSLEAFTTTAYRCMNRELKESPLMTDIVDGPGPRSDVTPSEGKDGAGPRSIVTPSLGKIHQSQFDPIMEERKRKRIFSQLGSERRTKLRKQYHLDILEAENLILRAKLSELDKLILPKGDNHSMD